ncbi:hypothetical protein SLEP1_g22534 [Rubroshorea leprosula]|uniref:Uncharacterized protein n=1 Tax=Rubroshorea leprosula TaxID=152421 RepID=A0AAV5JIR4_9ROSI|nr:hypothetical protein SLEP1_g22534 [Rubroshorea leprosula]
MITQSSSTCNTSAILPNFLSNLTLSRLCRLFQATTKSFTEGLLVCTENPSLCDLLDNSRHWS